MTAATAPDIKTRDLIVRIARTYLAPRKGRLAAALGCAAVSAAIVAALTKLMQPAIDEGIVGHNMQAITYVCLAIVGLAILKAATQIVQSRIVNRLGHKVVGEVQLNIFSSLIHADLARLRSAHSGGFVSSVLYDAAVMREATTQGVVNYTQQGLILVATVSIMLLNDWQLTLLTLLVGPLAFLVIRRFTRRTNKAAKGAMSESAVLSTAIMEGLDGVRIVKIENREDYEQGRVAAVIARRQGFLIKGSNARATSPPITEALMTMLIAGILAYVSWRSTHGAMTPGKFTTFLLALSAAGQAMRQLASLQTTIGEGLTAARRLFAVMDVPREVADRPGARPLDVSPERLDFQDVSFAYTDTPALAEVSLQARRGETIALVGPSGGGKSTVLNLVPRFYDVSAGRVRLDGVDVRDITLESLRSHIALVTQEPFLFDETIRANIAYARPGATTEEIEAAARAAAAHDFISVLEKGYDTEVGEAGLRLSGGQRQRIAIARAFLKDAPILLLDEATSALDTESEALVQAALERLMSGRLTILIAHRLSTVRRADRIYVLDAGRVVEVGDHDDLVRQGGLYARLAASQNLDTQVEVTAGAAG